MKKSEFIYSKGVSRIPKYMDADDWSIRYKSGKKAVTYLGNAPEVRFDRDEWYVPQRLRVKLEE